MAIKNRIAAIALSSINSNTLTGSYQVINAGGLPQPCFYVRINNTSDKDVTISYDGTTDNDVILAGTLLDLKFQTHIMPPVAGVCLAKGTQIYIKGTAGTGFIYISGYYTPQGA